MSQITREYTDNEKQFILLTGKLPQLDRSGTNLQVAVAQQEPFTEDYKNCLHALMRSQTGQMNGRRKSSKTTIGFDEKDDDMRCAKVRYKIKTKMLAKKLKKEGFYPTKKECMKIAKLMRRGKPVDGWRMNEEGQYFKI